MRMRFSAAEKEILAEAVRDDPGGGGIVQTRNVSRWGYRVRLTEAGFIRKDETGRQYVNAETMSAADSLKLACSRATVATVRVYPSEIRPA